jgi:hypothetical protein
MSVSMSVPTFGATTFAVAAGGVVDCVVGALLRGRVVIVVTTDRAIVPRGVFLALVLPVGLAVLVRLLGLLLFVLVTLVVVTGVPTVARTGIAARDVAVTRRPRPRDAVSSAIEADAG